MKKIYLLFTLVSIIVTGFAQVLPENWTGDTGIDTYQEATTVHSGTYSCRIDVNTGTQANCDLTNSTAISLTAGNTFTIKFWAYTSQYVRITGVLYWSTGSNFFGSTYVGPNTGGWQELVLTGTVPAGVTSANLGIRCYDVTGFTAPETQYVDDFTFESPTGTPILLTNGDMESWPAGNQLPIINNIVYSPLNPVSTETISVSADITDSDGTIASAELHWGTTSGSLTNTITMAGVGDTYTTDADIPAQASGTTIYFEIEAMDDLGGTTTSTEQSYDVIDLLVTFQVNMAEEVVSANGVHLAGGFAPLYDNWNPAGIEMTDADADQVYTVILTLRANTTYQFKYVNGNTWDWPNPEDVPDACSYPTTDNRYMTTGTSDVVLPTVCFGSCADCGALLNYNITFQVDMQNETVSGDGVYLAGSFTNWGTNAILMTQNGTIWSTTVLLTETNYEEYKFVNGNPNTGGSWESINNRQLNVPSANTTLGLVCFNSYAACPVADFVVINEADADQTGVDAAEFIELYDGGVGNTNLSGLVVVLYNGNNDLSYAAYDLDGYSTDANGYFLLGNAAVVPTPSIIFNNDLLQNGQDAIALYAGSASDFPNGTVVTTTNIVDALVYDTNDADDPALLVLLNAGQPQINEGARGNSVLHSMQRIPNGSGGQRNTITYDVTTPTPGAENTRIITTWIGSVSYDWNLAGNWDNGVPEASFDAVVPSQGTPLVVMDNSAVCYNLTFYPGGNIIVSESGGLTVYGDLSIDPGSTFLIASSALGTGSLITMGNITGNVDVERYIGESEWHLISSPVVGQTAEIFIGDYLQTYNEASAEWTDIEDEFTVFDQMKGYAFWGDPNAPRSATYTFNGVPGSGNLTFDFTSANAHGWNLVGNPYPSSIDWDLVTIPGGMNNAIYFLDAATGTYVSYLDANFPSASQYIPPMQGFWVSANSSGTLSFDNNVRTHQGADIFYKNEAIASNYMELQVQGGDMADKTYIRLNEEATAEFDGKYDAYKLMAANKAYPQLFTIAGGERLSINQLPATDVIPIGFYVENSGNYTISLNEMNDIQNCQLEDLKTGVLQDLQKGNYTFSYTSGEAENRFLLHLTAASVAQSGAEENVKIYAVGKEIFVKSVNPIESGVLRITGLEGRALAEKAISNETFIRLSTNLKSGIYLVTIVEDGGLRTEKIVIN